MTTTELTATDPIVEEVRARYADAARAVLERDPKPSEAAASCCGPSGEAAFGELLYSELDRANLPDAAVLASLGCGNPTAVAELKLGEIVLDLGSGGGIDVLLSAKRVGQSGFAFGLDMTDEMLELARRNAAEAGATNVEFRKGRMEAIPLEEGSVDVVISNCVINLSTDKAAVLAEIARVLRPGGRMGVSDVVAEDNLSPGERAERGSFVGASQARSHSPSTRPVSRPPDSSTSRSRRPTPLAKACTARSSGPQSRPAGQPHRSTRSASRLPCPA